MYMKKLTITGKVLLLGTATGFTLLGLTGCNKQMIDFNKSFNIAIEKNDEVVSVVGIDGYNDYSGSMVQISTDKWSCNFRKYKSNAISQIN